MAFPVVPEDSIGWLTTEQMVEVDRVMIEDLHIELIQMMENAGRNLARLALHRYSPDHVMVMAGSGGNGGGGLVAARHLHVAGAEVAVSLAGDSDRFGPIPRHQLDIVRRLGIPVLDTPVDTDLVIDAMIGYSLQGTPRGRTADLIAATQRSDAPVLALDTPSGLDTTSGDAHDPHVTADATLTLALPKVGLRSQPIVGDHFVADISVPPAIYAALEVGPAPDFAQGSIIKIEAKVP